MFTYLVMWQREQMPRKGRENGRQEEGTAVGELRETRLGTKWEGLENKSKCYGNWRLLIERIVQVR